MLKWAQVQARMPWGILIQLGVGVGLGTALLKTGAAAWLASYVVTVFDVQHLSVFAILAVLWLFLIVVHLGFASGAAMATTMIPVMISMLQQAQLPPQKIAGITMLLSLRDQRRLDSSDQRAAKHAGLRDRNVRGARLHSRRPRAHRLSPMRCCLSSPLLIGIGSATFNYSGAIAHGALQEADKSEPTSQKQTRQRRK